MATQDSPRNILFNAGEAITIQDLNGLQNLSQRKLGEYLYHAGIEPGDESGFNIRPVRNALRPNLGSGAMDIAFEEGTVLWHVDPDPGSPDPRVLIHEYDGSIEITVNAADASNERWDIISAKVETLDGSSETRVFKDQSTGSLSSVSLDKRNLTRLTLTYTAGTAAASPTEPSPPAGEVVIARIRVAAADTALSGPDVHDRRRPAGMYRVLRPAATAWGQGFTVDTDGILAFSNNGGTEAANFDITPPMIAMNRDYISFFSNFRLARVALYGSTNPNVTLNRRWWIDGSVDTLVGGDLGTTDFSPDEASEYDAIWCTGDARPLGNGSDVFLRSKLTTGSEIYMVEAYWWGGF